MLRRFNLLVLVLALILGTLTAVFAQPETPPEPQPVTRLDSPPAQMMPAAQPAQPQTDHSIFTTNASDECTSATTVTIPGGGSATVNDYTFNPGDPALTCAWGTRTHPNGYRTAWYKFTADSNGVITVDTLGSSYDTIVAVYRQDGSTACTGLVQVSCNDDAHGFTSRAQFPVSQGKTYYIEIADWQEGVSGDADLLFAIEQAPIESRWERLGNMPLPRSRHATVVVGGYIYTLGGQTNVLGNPTLTRDVARYNPATDSWTNVSQMPGVGLSNTTAAYVPNSAGGECTQGCIYIPGGYNGNNTTYDGTHRAYDIATGNWYVRRNITETAGLDWPDGEPFSWATAVTVPGRDGYYLMGGLSNQPAIATTAVMHNKVYFYDVSEDQWKDAPPDLNTARYGHMAAYVGGQLCVVGGITNNLVLLSDMECWDPNGAGGWVQYSPSLNRARYGAGSVVGPDGKWYVFGGSDGAHQAIPTVEVYDPANPAAGWGEFGVSYDLGGSGGLLARAWPRGEFVGSNLYAIGGNGTVDTYPAISLVERLFVGRFQGHLPVVANQDGENPPDDHMGVARPLPVDAPQFHNFDALEDFYDVFYFDLGVRTAVTVRLSQIPLNSNYDLQLVDANKVLLAEGDNPSNLEEVVPITLDPGRYYILVARTYPFGFPDGSNYRLVVNR